MALGASQYCDGTVLGTLAREPLPWPGTSTISTDSVQLVLLVWTHCGAGSQATQSGLGVESSNFRVLIFKIKTKNWLVLTTHTTLLIIPKGGLSQLDAGKVESSW